MPSRSWQPIPRSPRPACSCAPTTSSGPSWNSPPTRPATPSLADIHGGGIIMGDRFTNMAECHLVEWVAKFGLVVLSIEYRKAPEARETEPDEDCHSGLRWSQRTLTSWGSFLGAIILGDGSSAHHPDRCFRRRRSRRRGRADGQDQGGASAARSSHVLPTAGRSRRDSLRAPDGRGPTPSDGRANIISTLFYALLGDNYADRSDVSLYASAFRADDLRTTASFHRCGSSELFRDAATSMPNACGRTAYKQSWRMARRFPRRRYVRPRRFYLGKFTAGTRGIDRADTQHSRARLQLNKCAPGRRRCAMACRSWGATELPASSRANPRQRNSSVSWASQWLGAVMLSSAPQAPAHTSFTAARMRTGTIGSRQG
jgi:hypothetical protein